MLFIIIINKKTLRIAVGLSHLKQNNYEFKYTN